MCVESKEVRWENYEATRDWGDTDRGRHERTPFHAELDSANALGGTSTNIVPARVSLAL